MADCREIEEHLAAYVDGEAGAAERRAVDVHLQRCSPCRTRVSAESAARDVLTSRQRTLRGAAPDALRTRCAAQRALAATGSRPAARRVLLPLSLAATLILATSAVFLFGIGTSVETYAAQLAVDHVKCVQFPPTSAAVNPTALGRSWEDANGWRLTLTPAADPDRLELVGIRRCGSTRGRVAHLFYRWRGEPVSVYVLNSVVDGSPHAGDGGHGHASVIKLGERALIWTGKGRTYAVVARARTPDLEQVAALVRRTIE
jgi:anti-sigma factor RsiW